MKHIHIFGLILFALGFYSCETLVNDVDPDRLPRTDRKLVVHGYLSPQDTLIAIKVYYSTQVVGNDPYLTGNGLPIPLANASVTLSTQGKSAKLSFNSELNAYTIKPSEFPILEGQTYTLKVERDDQVAESSCTVPRAVAIQQVLQDSVERSTSNPAITPPKDYLYTLVWKDFVGQKNYYRVAGYVYLTQRTQTSQGKFIDNPNFSNLSFRDNNRSREFIDDQDADGAQITSGSGRFFNYYSSINTNSPFTLHFVEVSLIHCEKTYYDYHQAIQNFDRDNPFAEPSLIPSNIKNGLGCFAAYNRSSVVIKK
ncbi:MAG TPA: hypothetical protein DCR35_10405 [Runella sp.]|nr:hypothetical protein [Runella sp.]HAO49672.1 hypothetical protein [Runella sp.]